MSTETANPTDSRAHEFYSLCREQDCVLSVEQVRYWNDEILAMEERIRELEQFVDSLEGLREGCLSSYAGGYTRSDNEAMLPVFQHGMNTVCNAIDARLAALNQAPSDADPGAET